MKVQAVTIKALLDGKELTVTLTLRGPYEQLAIPQAVIYCAGEALSPTGIQVDYAR